MEREKPSKRSESGEFKAGTRGPGKNGAEKTSRHGCGFEMKLLKEGDEHVVL